MRIQVAGRSRRCDEDDERVWVVPRQMGALASAGAPIVLGTLSAAFAFENQSGTILAGWEGSRKPRNAGRLAGLSFRGLRQCLIQPSIEASRKVADGLQPMASPFGIVTRSYTWQTDGNSSRVNSTALLNRRPTTLRLYKNGRSGGRAVKRSRYFGTKEWRTKFVS